MKIIGRRPRGYIRRRTRYLTAYAAISDYLANPAKASSVATSLRAMFDVGCFTPNTPPPDE
jgi:hypothetical protein